MPDVYLHRSGTRTRDGDLCEVIFSSICHTLGISPGGENTEDRNTASPRDLDHLGFKGLHVLQKGLHGLSCVNYGLGEGKSKGKRRDEDLLSEECFEGGGEQWTTDTISKGLPFKYFTNKT